MKRLLNTLYVTSEDAYLSLDGDNVLVSKDRQKIGRFPLHTLESIVYFGRSGASVGIIGVCADRGIDLVFFSPNGKFLARTVGESRGNVLLRKEQYRIAGDADESLAIARNCIRAKIFNARWVIERACRDHPLQVDVKAMKRSSSELVGYIGDAAVAASVDELRGIEGSAARCYYRVFDQLIFGDKETFHFEGRNRRPPKDPVNALLSFSYSMLTSTYASALEGVGLDPYVGFMHSLRPGRKSLALDLVEELRSVYADRVVLTCLNTRVLNKTHFEKRENGAVYLTDGGRKAFLNVWQLKKRETLTHPYLEEKVPWGLIPHVQAMLLARCVRGDLDGYPPFMWK